MTDTTTETPTTEVVEATTRSVPAAAMTGGELLPESGTLKDLWNLCKSVAGTGFLPQAIRTPEQAFAIALKARELGIPPMMGFGSIHIIQGKTEISAQTMNAMLRKGGVSIEEVEVSREAVELVMRRPMPNGREDTVRSRFTIDDAKMAGLTGKDNWKKHAEEMLYARALSKGARRIGPDLIHGAYTDGEITMAPPSVNGNGGGFAPKAETPPARPAPKPEETRRDAEATVVDEPSPRQVRPPTPKQRKAVHAVSSAIGLDEADVRLMIRGFGSTSDSTGDMSGEDCSRMLDALMAVQKSGDPDTPLWEPINAAIERGKNAHAR